MHTPFNFHQDAGHGWLEVPAEAITNLGLTPAAFSSYSYVDKHKIYATVYYLEEDCDLPLFALAYANRYFQKPAMKTVYHDGDCFVRQLGHNMS